MNQTETLSTSPQHRYIIYFSMFVMGGCGLAYEYTLSKLAADLLGNSIRQWAIIIAVMMFFMGVGADIQKYFKQKFLVEYFLGVEILLGLVGAFAPISILFAYGHFDRHFLLVEYFFVAMIGLLLGFELPLLTRINSAYDSRLSYNLGSLLKMDYFGALLGGVTWAFILTKYFDIVETAFILGLVNLGAATIAFIYFYRQLVRPQVIGSLLVFSFLYVILGYTQADRWTLQAEQALYRDPLIFSQTSPYQHIALTRSRGGHVSLYINNQLQFNSFDEHIYHENLVHPSMAIAERRKNILILGGGDGLALREVLKYPDVESVVLCDLDPMMTNLARDHEDFVRLNKGSLRNAKVHTVRNQALTPGPRDEMWIDNRNSRFGREAESIGKVTVMNIDAIKFLEQFPGRYDVVVIDFPDPNTDELSKLYSKRFYLLLKQKLFPWSVVVQQSTSPIFAKEAFLIIGRTLRSSGFSSLPYHDSVPSFGDWGFWVGVRQSYLTEKQLEHRFRNVSKISVSTRYLTPHLLKSAFHFGVDQLQTTHQDINTISSNRIYRYYEEGWKKSF